MLWSRVWGPRVLELGVGTGKNMPHYPADAAVTAIDISSRMLARAKRAAAEHPEAALTLSLMDAQQLAFAGETFDMVVGTFVFCSVPDPVLGLREALRVAKPGSRLLLLEHMRAEQAAVGQAMQVVDPAVHWLTGVHIARRTIRNVHRAGWRIESVTPLSPGDIFRLIEARKV